MKISGSKKIVIKKNTKLIFTFFLYIEQTVIGGKNHLIYNNRRVDLIKAQRGV